MPNVTPELFDKVGNQTQYNGNQTTALANMMAQMFGVPSIDQLPESMQPMAQQVASTIMNTYGDQMGMLNQGNLFANIHQGILASGSMPVTNQKGSLLGVASGAGARSMQTANIMAQAAGNYFADKNGVPKLENTHGMSGQLFSGLAGNVVANRGVKEGDVMTVQSGKGSAQLLGALQDATERGASKDTDQYRNAVQTYRVAREYEKFKEKHESFKDEEHQNNLKEMEKLNKKGDNLTDQEKGRKQELAQEIERVNSQIREDFRNEAVGKQLKETEVNGRKYGKSEITDNDATAAMDQVDNGGGQWEMGTDKLQNDLNKALKSTSKNVATLGKMFHTNDFAELQRAVEEMGMGSLSDARNVDNVAKRIANIQQIAKKTGRSVESVILEQKQIMEQLADSFGGVENIDPKTVQHIQRASASAEEDRNKLGHGPTGEQVAAEEAARTSSALSGGTQHMAAGQKLLDMAEAGEVDVSEEDQAKMKKLQEAWKNAKSPQEQDRIAKEMQSIIVGSQGENTQQLYDEAMKEYGQDYADKRTESKLQAQREKLFSHKFQGKSKKEIKEMAEVAGQLQETEMKDIMDAKSPKEQKEVIEKLAKESGLEGEDLEKYKESLNKFAGMGDREQKAIRGLLRTGGAATRVTTAKQKAQMKQEVGKQMLENELFSDEMVLPDAEHGGLKGFTAGLLKGDQAITKKQAAAMAVASYADEKGQLGEKEIEKLNEENNDLNVLAFDEKTGKLKNADKALDSKMVDKEGKEQEIWKMMGYESKEEAVKASQTDLEGFSQKMRKFKEEQGYESISLGNGNVALGKTSSLDTLQQGYDNQRKIEKNARAYADAFGGRMTDVEIDPKTGKITGGKIDGKQLSGDDFQQRADELASNTPEIRAALDQAKAQGMEYESGGEDMEALIAGMKESGVSLKDKKAGNKALAGKARDRKGKLPKNKEERGKVIGAEVEDVREDVEKGDDETKGTEESRNFAKAMRDTLTATQVSMTKEERGKLNKALENKYKEQGLKGEELKQAVENASQEDVARTLASNKGILTKGSEASKQFGVLTSEASKIRKGMEAGGSQSYFNWEKNETEVGANTAIAQGMKADTKVNEANGGVATVDFSGLEKPLGQVATAVTSDGGGALRVVVMNGDK